jgi:hypothetical protein
LVASAFTGAGFVGISRTSIVAVGCAVVISVGVGCAATANTRIDLVGIVGAGVDTIRCSIIIAVGFRIAATAKIRLVLVGIIGTLVAWIGMVTDDVVYGIAFGEVLADRWRMYR